MVIFSRSVHRTTCILGRRYSLTLTCYKYLEIGISVGLAPCVEIALSDNRGNRLVFTHQIWKALMDTRMDIDQLLQTSPLWIQNLLIENVTFQNIKVVKLNLLDATVYIKRETLDKLFNLELCIDHMYSWLCNNINIVAAKFKKFVNVLQQQNITAQYYSLKQIDWDFAIQAIRDSDDFDCTSIIDCELLACSMHNIVQEALKKK